MASRPCFHCGEAIPDGPLIVAKIGGAEQPMCCIGCKSVAEFIAGSDLGAFYEHRQLSAKDGPLTPVASDWRHFDSDSLRNKFVHSERGLAEATLDIGGMYCSACAWLLDSSLRRVDGIESMSINTANKRAVIRWYDDKLAFSDVLEGVSRIGFQPSPVGPDQQSAGAADEYRQSLKRLIVAAAAGMQVMMFAVAMYAGDYFGIDADVRHFLRTISLLVTLPIVFYAARPFFRAAWRGLKQRAPSMDVPVSVAIGGAFVASTIATWHGSGEVYFDSVAMFVFFLTATRFLEMRARHRSDDLARAMSRLLPDTVTRITANGDETIATDLLQAGDRVRLRPGDIAPCDGTVEEGDVSVDESMLSGESLPVDRLSGERVFAGSLVKAGNAVIVATNTGASTSLAEIGRMLERARSERSPQAMLADRIAGRFVSAVLGIAAMAGIYWSVVDPTQAFDVVLATLVVTCPCALALATPAAIAAAASQLASRGFLVVRARVLEALNAVAVAVFDKTGTLTEGRPVIRDVEVFASNYNRETALSLAAALESASEHVLARAFEPWKGKATEAITNARVVAGEGVEAFADGRPVRLGRASFVAEIAGDVDDSVQDATTRVYFGDAKGLIARFAIGDAVRDDAARAIDRIRVLGIRPVIASGDGPDAVRTVAEALGIEDWHASLSPSDKLKLIDRLQCSGESAVMVGDGVNDAPVLAAADASIAMDAGTALARASADAVCLGTRLETVADAFDTAGRTRRIIRQNIAWAIGYNLTAVPLAVAGLVAPWMAALGMSLSSLLVVMNALRLRRDTEAHAQSASAGTA